jgi:anion transporter
MDSLATVLRRIPIFQDLPPGSFARIIADLREEQHPAGTVVCYEGEPAHDFYVIKSGHVEVLTNRGRNERELVAVSGPSDWFGERALFSDRPRSATVVARTDVALWRLTKEKFDTLIEENPWLILHFTQVLSDRLHRGNQELSKMHAAFDAHMQALLQAQPPDRREFLLRTAVLRTLDPAIVSGLFGQDGRADVFANLETGATFVVRHEGTVRYLDAVREFLLARLTAEVGTAEVARLQRQAAVLYERTGQWDRAVDLYIDAGETRSAVHVVAQHVDDILAESRLDVLRMWLNRLPADVIAAELPGAREQMEAALHPLRADAGAAVQPPTQPAARGQWLAAIVGMVAGVGIWLMPPFDGLTPDGMHMLGLLAWAAVFWAFDVLPDYVVGLTMIIGWILFHIVPAEVAVSGFTAGPFFLIIGVLGIGASLQSSGLLFRLALNVLRGFPLTHRGQLMGVALSGTLMNPGIPDSTSGAAIAGPIVLAVSDSLGYARLSNGSAALAMAAVLGFGQMCPFFLTGAAENLLAWGLLPEAAHTQITWAGWAYAALPLAVTTFALGFAATLFFLPPEAQPSTSRGLIETQIEALGPPSRAELVNGAVLLGAMIGWLTAPLHGVDVAWVAMIGLAVLLAANLLDRMTFRAGIYWDFLFYLGAVLSLTDVVRYLGVDAWVIRLLTPILEPLTAQPARFLIVMALAVFAARFIMPSIPLVSMLIITVVPIAAAAHLEPLALTLVICTSVTVWFLPYQSTYYLALYFGTKEQAFSHRQVRALAWSYGAIYLVAIAAAIPFWRHLGMLP